MPPWRAPPRVVIERRAVRLFAHRGGMAHRRENTIDAFLHAQALGSPGVETDAWLTADGVAVLHHDAEVWTAGGRVPIASLRREQLPAHVPSLADLYRACGPLLDVAVDVLDPAAAPAIVADAEAAAPAAPARLWLCSTDTAQLAAWRALHGDIHLVHSDADWRRHRRDWGTHAGSLRARGIDVLNLHHRRCSEQAVAACHGHHIALFAWGVQRVDAMRRLLDIGVDGLMSDHVDRLLAVLPWRPDQFA